MTKTFVIAECGSCHGGSLEMATLLVDRAASAGADAAKFQYWSSAARMATRRRAQDYEGMYRRYQVPEQWLAVLAARCAERGIQFMCSTFLPEDVDVVAPHVGTLKIASFEANDPVHLAAHIAPVRAGKPLLVSCGLAADRRVIWRHLADHVGMSSSIRALWCVSAYPAPEAELQLWRLARRTAPDDNSLLGRYSGFSDHSPAMQVLTGALAVAAGADVLERHLRLDLTPATNPEFPHAMPPDAFAEYVKLARFAEAARGDVGEDRSPACERPMRAYRVRPESEP